MYTASYWRSTVVINSEIVGKKTRICTRPTPRFTVGRVRELAAEEFQVMFRMSTDSFDGPSRRFPRHTACLDGPSIDNV